MTAISLLAGDFSLEMPDEFVSGGTNRVGTFMIRRGAAPSTTVHSTNDLYSAVAEVTDDFIAMGFRNPMLPVTPNEYTMENKAFITREATQFLKEGTITANWVTGADPGESVLAKVYSGGTNFVAGDIGRQVIEATSLDEGTLLDFEILPNGTLLAWIRPSTAADTFALTTALSTTGGTGAPTTTQAATNGTISFNAIQAIGSVPTATDVYVAQDRLKMTGFDGEFQWWATDTNVNLGIISVLIRTRDPASASWPQIKNADLEIFARRYTAQYDNFRLNVAGGGFQALPLASSPDINNTTGYRRTTLSAASGTWNAGNGIYVGASWAAATARGVLTVGGSGATPILEYYLVGDLTDLTVTPVFEYDFLTQANGDGEGTAGAPVANLLGPTDPASAQGGTVTITLGATAQDHDGDSVNESYSIIVNAQSNVPIAKVYERLKYVTRRGATTADLFGAGTNVPGETYRGLEGTFEYDANTGTMTQGDDVIISTRTGFSARLMALVSAPPGSEPTHITLTDIQSSLVSNQPSDDDVVEDETGDDVTLHGGGTFGIVRYTSPKSSPFGTFTGSQIFGGRGVYFSNPAGADTQAYILTDNLGVLRTPPNTVAFIVANTRAGDRILVARDTGTAGIINKDLFGGMAVTSQSLSVLNVAGAIDSEVAQSGFVRVVETTLQEEHRYRYSSRTGSAFNLTLLTGGTGSATSASTTQLIDTVGGFLGAIPVLVGDLVRNTFAGKTTHVWEVTNVVSDTVLDVSPLYGPLTAAQDWDSGDTYEINETIQAYTTSDNIFDLLLDVEETTGTSGTPGTEQNTFVQSTLFNVVVIVRQGKVILPFTANVPVTATGGGVTVVRSPDTIAV